MDRRDFAPPGWCDLDGLKNCHGIMPGLPHLDDRTCGLSLQRRLHAPPYHVLWWVEVDDEGETLRMTLNLSVHYERVKGIPWFQGV